MHGRPVAFPASKQLVHLLDLTTVKVSFDVQVKAYRSEDHTDRLAVLARRLCGECINNVLEDEPWTASFTLADSVIDRPFLRRLSRPSKDDSSRAAFDR
jgi:hypothetical protein